MNLKFLKVIYFFLPIVFFNLFTFQLNAQSIDSIDVLNYNINLDLSKFKSKNIVGVAEIKCKPLQNIKVNKIKFMLLKLNIDSIFFKDSLIDNYLKVIFNYNDTIITIDKNLEKISYIKIYYHGSPAKDQSWGGFYFSGEYAFNLGVAFTSKPHNFGRVWFPCIDNFADKAIFKYSVKVPRGYTAVCGGLFADTLQMSDNSTVWNWEHNVPINTYLASVAVAPYKFVKYIINGKVAKIPIMLAAIASDTSKLKSSFSNLQKAVQAFEEYYGKFRFERIGYSLVPFNSGAMEHSCNIAYPVYAADGTSNYETLMAHELSHNWWGNNTTCQTAVDMWLNEGWASFSEALFTEYLYGKTSYRNYMNKIHKEVLQFAHLKDGAISAISNISHENTYGTHVYKKGADMVHTIRNSMSEIDFKNACNSFMEKYKYSNVTTPLFISHFAGFGVNRSFLNQMIKDTGFCHFTIFNSTYEFKNNSWEISVNYKNRSRMSNHVFDSIPCEFYVYDKKFNKEIFKVWLGKNQSFKVNTKLKPEFICFDFEGKLSDAITDEYIITDSIGNFNFDYAMMNIKINSINDSSLVRVEHHWNYPDEYFLNLPDITISKERFWKVDGIFSQSFQASAIINYDGSKLTSYTSGWLDNKLLQNQSEDSIVLLYRPNAESYWQIEKNIVKTIGGKTDKKGTITINELKKGEYTLALKGKKQSSGYINPKQENSLKLYPNPADHTLYIEFKENKFPQSIEISDLSGKLHYSDKVENNCKNMQIDTCGFLPGNYFINFIFKDGFKTSESFVICR